MDLLDSFKGAGVIGTFLGAFVLVGFIVLSFLVFDPRFVDPFMSDASIVRGQEREISRLEGELERMNERVAAHDTRYKAAEELEMMLRENQQHTAMVKALAGEIDKVKMELRNTEEEDVEYRKQFRAKLRREAAGETMAELVTTEGKFLQEVVILSVSPAGLHVRHRDGTARISFTNLPEAVRQRFQFDLDEMQVYMETESREIASHEQVIDAGLSKILAERKAARVKFLEKRIPLLRERMKERERRLASGKWFSNIAIWTMQEMEASDREELQRILPEYERLTGEMPSEVGTQ